MPKMSPENFSETTHALAFEAEYDDATRQISSERLFLPDDEMDEDEDEGDVNTMLMPFDPLFAANPQGGNQDTVPANNRESGNVGERPVRVRV